VRFSTEQMRPQARDALEDEIDGDDVIQKTRDDEDEDAGNERDERLQQHDVH
jgi:hypothetical protein